MSNHLDSRDRRPLQPHTVLGEELKKDPVVLVTDYYIMCPRRRSVLRNSLLGLPSLILLLFSTYGGVTKSVRFLILHHKSRLFVPKFLKFVVVIASV